MINVLIIGANGMLGSKIMNYCLLKNWNVEAIYNDNDDYISVNIKKTHIENIKQCMDCYQYVFITTGNFSNNIDELINNNILIALFCHENFKNAKLIYISSINVYGTNFQLIDENAPFCSPNTYGLSKISSEFIIMAHPKYSIVRPSIILNERINHNTFIYKIIYDAKYKKKIDLMDNGNRKQDYISVDDVANICVNSTGHDNNDIFLAVFGKSYSNYEIASFIQQISNCTIEINTNIVNNESYIFDGSKSNEKLNYLNRKDILPLLKSIYDKI